MRGEEEKQPNIWSHVSMEERIPVEHPLREIRELTDSVLASLSDKFDSIYIDFGRPSIPPDYNLLYRWFMGLSADDPAWNPSVFSKSRDRLMEGGVADAFFRGVLEVADDKGLISDEHFTIDGTLLEAAASLKNFQKKDQRRSKSDDDPGNPSVSFHGEKRKTIRTNRTPILTPGFFEKVRARNRDFATWDMCL